MNEKHIALEIELPNTYTADLDSLREYRGHYQSESDWLLSCLGDPGPACRLRVEASGEKGGEVQEVWGVVKAAKLVDPTPNHAEFQADWRLLRDEDSCEWCDYDRNAVPSEGE